MKFFSLLLGIICLLESVMIPVCMDDQGSVEFISYHDDKQSCCPEQNNECELSHQSSSDECESLCSPFQHCGCSKLGSNATLIVFLGLTEIFDSILEREEILGHVQLPDSFLSLNDPPPKFS